jgi:hypothetical protein
MNWIPSFVAWPFAVAGLIAAAGPVVIHLLNRRRFRTVEWAAMDFLREALQRNRRILHIRDLLLLTLRTLAVLLVGLALAQPFFSVGREAFDGSEPLHAVLLIDNSLSMARQSMDGTALDRAKQRARRLIDRLPDHSRVTVVAVCGSQLGRSPDAATKDAALQFLDQIQVADRAASVRRAINQAVQACSGETPLAPRLVLFSDQQASNWYGQFQAVHTDQLPPLQVVDVSADQAENTWIADLRLQDGLADVQTPATLIVQLRHQGLVTRRDVEVRLYVDGVQTAAKAVSLEPGQGAREVTFQHVFDNLALEPGAAVDVPVAATLTADNLPEDDSRCLVVPVVAGLPVVFVDQYGAERENPIQNRVGATRHLRRLLAPSATGGGQTRQLIQIRHLTLDQLTRDVLADSRLVVMAGVADPGRHVTLLREYVLQGGQLVIVAGGDGDAISGAGFDPGAWSTAAWLDGEWILPAPLLSDPLGVSLNEAGSANLRPFFLSFDSLAAHGYFRLAGVGEQELRDLYAEPLFFKAIRADLGPDVSQQVLQEELRRLREQLAAADGASADSETGDAWSDSTAQTRWLLWQGPEQEIGEMALPDDPDQRQRRWEELASHGLPRTLAAFDDDLSTPYLVARRIGRGDVLFVASDLLAEWNTLPTTNAMLLFDRILRQMILSTLPVRNREPDERLVVRLPSADRQMRVLLRRPGSDQAEILDAGFIGPSQYGCTIDQPLERGIYQVAVHNALQAGGELEPETVWQTPLAVNGPAEESDLQPISRDEWESRTSGTDMRWVGPGEEISLAGTQVRGQHSWWWLIAAVIGLLALELLMLAGMSRTGEPTGSTTPRMQR